MDDGGFSLERMVRIERARQQDVVGERHFVSVVAGQSCQKRVDRPQARILLIAGHVETPSRPRRMKTPCDCGPACFNACRAPRFASEPWRCAVRFPVARGGNAMRWKGKWRNQYGSILEIVDDADQKIVGSFRTALDDS